MLIVYMSLLYLVISQGPVFHIDQKEKPGDIGLDDHPALIHHISIIAREYVFVNFCTVVYSRLLFEELLN